MRRLLNVVFQIVMGALVIFLFTAAWIVFDGLTDLGDKADVALVTGHAETPQDNAEESRLDRVIKLYNDGEFPFIILSGSTGGGAYEELAAMTKYLESHGIPSSAIIESRRWATTQETARDVAEIMKSHQFESVMVITDYYHETRVRLALNHEGITSVEKAHVGKLRKEDALQIGREVVALYAYIGKIYLLPEAEKVKKEAQAGVDKAKVDAEQAKQRVDKNLDGLPK